MKIKEFFPNKRQESSGQIIILLAVSLLVLLIFAALAIDGGMLYSERRFSQNAADASSLAAASWTANRMADKRISWNDFDCNSVDPDMTLGPKVLDGFSEAILRAASNNFSNNFVGTTPVYTTNVDTYNAFSSNNENGMIAYCNNSEKYIDFKVRITTETSTAFLHLISPGALKNTVEAVTRLDPQSNLGYGNAIVSLNNSCDNATEGLVFGGLGNTESGVTITGGGLWSNDCMGLNGGAIVTVNPESAGANLIDPDGVDLDGTVTLNADENIVSPDDAIDIYSDAYEIKDLLDEICDGYTDGGELRPHGAITVTPGRYTGLTIGNGDTVTLTNDFTNDGGQPYPVYCFDGPISMTDGVLTSVSSTDPLVYDPVIIYLREGRMTVNGGEVTIYAPDVNNDFYILDGLLIFMDPDDTYTITLAGNGTSYYSGTILNLNGDISISGTSDIDHPQTYSTQLIGNNVTVNGNVGIDINFDLSQNVTRAPKLNLLR